MALILKLTDGTTTLDLNGITDYAIPAETWTPAVASRSQSNIVGSLYSNVVENIPLHIRGATGAAALSNLTDLVNLLYQAERWFNGEPVAAVRLQYKPHNSALTTPVEAVVLRAPGAENLLQLSPFVNGAGNYEIPEINLELIRRGLWLGDEESTSSSTLANEPHIATLSFSAAESILSPTNIQLNFTNSKAHQGFLFAAAVPVPSTGGDYIGFEEAEDFIDGAAPTDYSSVADASNLASGNLLRFTPSAVDTWRRSDEPSSVATVRGGVINVFAKMRNNDTSKNYKIRIQFEFGSGYSILEKSLTFEDTNPTIIHVGSISIGVGTDIRAKVERIYLQADSTGSSLDIDNFVFITNTDESNVLFIQPSQPTITGEIQPGIFTGQLTVQHRLLSHINSAVTANDYVVIPSRGNTKLFTSTEDVHVCWYTVADNYWTGYSSERLQVGAVARRRPGYLSPL